MRYLPQFGLPFLLASCVGFTVPSPPEYSDVCVPTHDYFYRMAHDTQDMIPLPKIPKDLKEAREKALAEIDSHGVEVLQKSTNDPTALYTTTLPGQIYLAAGFYESDEWLQVATLWHELVHIYQWERMGEQAFVEHYAFAEGRWALEVPAYRQDFMVLRHFGAKEEDVLAFQKKRFEALYEGYALGTMPRNCAEVYTLEVWSIDNR